jgi:pimeloyl-ACP methyl ester carboxylesterase
MKELRAKGVDPANFTTAESVEDIADVAKALHLDKIVLFGVSYGTHDALRFMRTHPAMVAQNVDVEGFRNGFQTVLHIAEESDRPEQFVVVDDTTVIIQKKGVLAFARLQAVNVVRQQVVQPSSRAVAADEELSHVRDVECADRGAHGGVFIENARVLYRHMPAAEIDHASSHSNVFVVQWSLLELSGGGHRRAG